MTSVKQTLDSNLCSMCGACMAICPKKAIGVQESKDNKFAVTIDGEKCVECGLCERVCPNTELDYAKSVEIYQNEKNNKWEVYIAAAQDENIVKDSVSGGFISTLLRYVLANKVFDAVVTVIGYDCRKPVYSDIVKNLDGLQNHAKSRYIPVLHTKVFEHILKNRNQRLVFVGVPCAVKAFQNIINAYRLNRDNYLVVGLFCDRNFTYKINDYFSSYLANSREIRQTFFRTKKYSSYPGDGLLILEDGTEIKFSGRERAKVKDYFQMERCLYCVDKFAVEADISVGDNYTKETVSNHSFGENNLIVRTEKGKGIIDGMSSELLLHPVSAEAVKASQHMNTRGQNIDFLAIKQNLSSGISKERRREYFERCRKSAIGKKYTMNSSNVIIDLKRKEFFRKVRKCLRLFSGTDLRKR